MGGAGGSHCPILLLFPLPSSPVEILYSQAAFINKLCVVPSFASGNVPYNNFINLLYRCLTSVHVDDDVEELEAEQQSFVETARPQSAIYLFL